MELLIQELRTFIVDNFLFGDASGRFTFSDDDSFQRRGIVDSTGIMELVMFLESMFGVKIQPEEVIPGNLDSVSRAAQFLARKRNNAARTGCG